ncbi:MAG: putative flap endonuclease-1-like 5' DNA nuclease [Ilumatobacter sp.]
MIQRSLTRRQRKREDTVLYTLSKFLAWGCLLAFIGGSIGWMLRALKCRGEVAEARAATVDQDEVERMRHRLANLEQVVAERDRLRMQVADMRHADSPGVVGLIGGVLDDVADVNADDGTGSVPDTSIEQTVAVDERQTVRPVDGPASDHAGGEANGDAPNDDGARPASIVPETGVSADGNPSSVVPAPVLNLAAAATAIGKKIKLDDLTAVEGIGPKIAELCRGIGVTTWQELADTKVLELQSMLDAAGSRYAVHKPESWPQQAGLLARGLWDEFTSLTEDLNSGR